ncbi:hypothetical protein ACEZCY_14095 [Streptacidiphilus sp. N1-12]|uniref:Uncharacterized protein n=2 Tax=Streptacidiphilus alkalitolerans TaxID=3342712 RepID=A0ABV6WEC4_9ACTN
MLHALMWAWLLVLALLASAAATTSFRMTDVHRPSSAARAAHLCLIVWVAAGFFTVLGSLLWDLL